MIKASIFGDSISTYEGYNPIGYNVFYNEQMQRSNGLNSVSDTWWYQVLKNMNYELCVNNSFSGCRISGYNFPSASSYQRINDLKKETTIPDIILIYMGVNDFGYGIKIKNDFDNNIDLSCFEDSYDYMLKMIKKYYPNTKIVCATLLKGKVKDYEEWDFPDSPKGISFEEYNNTIRKIVTKENCMLADLAAYDIRYETLDGVHPTINGHKTIADVWIKE